MVHKLLAHGGAWVDGLVYFKLFLLYLFWIDCGQQIADDGATHKISRNKTLNRSEKYQYTQYSISITLLLRFG